MGLIIDGPTLAGTLSRALDEAFLASAYRVTLGTWTRPMRAAGL